MFCDVDEKKIKKQFYTYEKSKVGKCPSHLHHCAVKDKDAH